MRPSAKDTSLLTPESWDRPLQSLIRADLHRPREVGYDVDDRGRIGLVFAFVVEHDDGVAGVNSELADAAARFGPELRDFLAGHRQLIELVRGDLDVLAREGVLQALLRRFSNAQQPLRLAQLFADTVELHGVLVGA